MIDQFYSWCRIRFKTVAGAYRRAYLDMWLEVVVTDSGLVILWLTVSYTYVCILIYALNDSNISKWLQQYYDMDLQMNDEQLEIVSNRLTDGLAKERRRVEWAHEKLAYEKKVVTGFQAQVNKLETEEKANSTSLQEIQEVCETMCIVESYRRKLLNAKIELIFKCLTRTAYSNG